jgi:uncharacterized protein
MIAQNLQRLIGEAMKAGNFRRTETLRMLSSEFNYARIALQHDLTDEEEKAVIKKQVKQRRDSIEAYDKAGRTDLSVSEKEELAILQEFIPPEMSDEELSQLVNEAVKTINPQGMQDMGKVIGYIKGKAPDADGGKIAGMVKQKLEASS